MSYNKEEGRSVSVAGKISSWSFVRLQRILDRLGININQMIQNFVDCIIRNMDDRHNLRPDTEKVMATFENMVGWESNFNLTNPDDAKKEICEAIYFMVSENDKKGVRAVLVERPFFGTWKQNFNLSAMLSRFMELVFPQLYKRLMFIAECRQASSVLELLIEVVGELEREEDKKEYLQPFEDADRSEYGRKPHETQYKQKKTRFDKYGEQDDNWLFPESEE